MSDIATVTQGPVWDLSRDPDVAEKLATQAVFFASTVGHLVEPATLLAGLGEYLADRGPCSASRSHGSTASRSPATRVRQAWKTLSTGRAAYDVVGNAIEPAQNVASRRSRTETL